MRIQGQNPQPTQSYSPTKAPKTNAQTASQDTGDIVLQQADEGELPEAELVAAAANPQTGTSGAAGTSKSSGVAGAVDTSKASGTSGGSKGPADPRRNALVGRAPAAKTPQGASRSLRGKAKGNATNGTALHSVEAFKKLATQNPKVAASKVKRLIEQGKSSQAAALVTSLLGGNPKEDAACKAVLGILGKLLPGVTAKYSSAYLMPFLQNVVSQCATHGMKLSSFMSALQGMSGLMQIAQFFKTVGSWLIDNYNQANKTHAYSGHLDGLAQFQAKLGAGGMQAPIAPQQAHKIIQTLTQQYEQKLSTQLQQRHGASVNLSTTGKKHLVQTDINNHKRMLEAYKQGLQNALQQHNTTSQGPNGKLFGVLVKTMAQKASGSQHPSVSDYRAVLKQLCDKQIAKQSGLS